MGEFDASSSPWKRMVLSKQDSNKWTSNIKSEMSESTSASNTSGFSIDYNPYSNIKVEMEEVNNDSYQNIQPMEEPESSMVQELDPLSLLAGAGKRRRRNSAPKDETPEERAVRLAKMSAYAAQRLANETPEQRALRLKRMSEYAAKRLAQETSEQRAKRLSRMSAYAAKRLAKETPEQRQTRLTRMSEYAARRQAMKKYASTAPTITPQADPPNQRKSTVAEIKHLQNDTL